MAGWIKMELGIEVGFGSDHNVLDRDPAALSKNGAEPPPIFLPFLRWPNGCMRQDATWYGGWPQLRQFCVRWGPSPPLQKGAEPTNFRPTSIVAKRLHGPRCHLVRR